MTEIRKAAPNGIDIQFENVGGDTLDAACSAIRLRPTKMTKTASLRTA
ncbi:hypothetical protein [Rhodomicrobium vannielii]|nr:hypothetical protein [Rhodomicrobium vannielii]